MADLKGRLFPPFDILNTGMHSGQVGGNTIDQEEVAKGHDQAAALLRSKAIVCVGGHTKAGGDAGSKRYVEVTSRYELP